METYLNLFENVIREQTKHLGDEEAFAIAKKAGLGISKEGHIVSCAGNPQLVLLRLLRLFSKGGKIQSFEACAPLIDELLKSQAEEETTTETVG